MDPFRGQQGGGGGGGSGGGRDAPMLQSPEEHEMAMQEAVNARFQAEFMHDMFTRLTSTCFQKCVPRFRDSDLSVGEASCVDRCTLKFIETQNMVGEKLGKQNQQQNQAMAADGDSIKQLSDVKSETNWTVFSLDGAKLVPAKSGSGGLAELLGLLKGAESVYFGAFRVFGVDNRENVTSKRLKVVSFVYIPDTAGGVTRGKALAQRANFQKMLQGVAMDLDVGSDLKTLESKEIIKRLLAAGGAHKPTHYDFGGGQVEEAVA